MDTIPQIMVKFKFFQKWSKLGRKNLVLKDDKKSVRLSVGLNEECMEVIENCSKNMGIFNGLTDFLTTSLREFYYPYVQYANDELIDLIEKYPNYPAKALEELEKIMAEYLETYINGFNKDFGDGPSEQKSFYVSRDLRERIYDIECMSGKEPSEIIKAAICYQILRIGERFDVREGFVQTYMETSRRAYGD